MEKPDVPGGRPYYGTKQPAEGAGKDIPGMLDYFTDN